jgi:sialic acid synthase SpsE/mannose-6-phosphate isomerase-like protein (cupin superfamily)
MSQDAASLFGVTSRGPLFCLELANNHQGQVDHGRRLLDAIRDVAATTAADVLVKLQFRELATFLHEGDRMAVDGDPLTTHATRFRTTELSWEDFRTLVTHARAIGLRVYATPFDEASVDRCIEFEFDVIKIASCSAYDWPLLDRVAEAKRPVICSVAGLALNEVDDVVDFFGSRDIPLALLHCVGAYPTPVADLQLDQVSQLRHRFPAVPIGYSGHESGDDLFVAGLAVAKGAVILERHVGLRAPGVALNTYSLTPDQTEGWIREAQRAFGACSNGRPRRDVAGERASLQSLRRGIYARRTIAPGRTLGREDVYLAMPCLEGQFHAGKLDEIVGAFTPMEPVYANMPVGLTRLTNPPRRLLLASIAGRVREMLAEARVELAPGSAAELSHQYGFDRFFDCGAIIIDVVNRDYCKKLIVQFPGQQHPSHRHLRKEETFQVISGSVHLDLDGATRLLRAGETQLIERGRLHRFWTDTGVIFEEISTTHIKGDSEYDDASIPSDPTTRKSPLPLL